MNKVEVNYFLADSKGEGNEHICSVDVLYVAPIGTRIFLKEDEFDFQAKKISGKYKVNGEYIVKDIHQVLHNKASMERDGDYLVPIWETKERLEVTLIEVK